MFITRLCCRHCNSSSTLWNPYIKLITKNSLKYEKLTRLRKKKSIYLVARRSDRLSACEQIAFALGGGKKKKKKRLAHPRQHLTRLVTNIFTFYIFNNTSIMHDASLQTPTEIPDRHLLHCHIETVCVCARLWVGGVARRSAAAYGASNWLEQHSWTTPVQCKPWPSANHSRKPRCSSPSPQPPPRQCQNVARQPPPKIDFSTSQNGIVDILSALSLNEPKCRLLYDCLAKLALISMLS